MQVKVLTKTGCARCFLAKDKLQRLGIEYEEEEGIFFEGESIPMIVIEGVRYDYASAMKKLKEEKNEGQ